MKKSLTITICVVVIIVLGASILIVLENNNSSASSSAANYSYKVVNTYPHDTSAFTEGLWYYGGFLYESSGLNVTYGGVSTLRMENLTTGAVVREYTLPSQYFGEGITIINNTIIQLTWQSNIGFIYDKNTFALLGNFTFTTQGWGLTNDGTQLIMSDGTDHLYFLNPATFQQTSEITVHDGNTDITNVNSLAWIKGEIYANIWQKNEIAIVNPQTGQVKAWINLTGLPDEAESAFNPDAVLNGIAYDQQNNRIFVTGKDWPNIYQIEVVS